MLSCFELDQLHCSVRNISLKGDVITSAFFKTSPLSLLTVLNRCYMESLAYIIFDQVDFSRLVSHRYPTNLFMSISWRAIPTAVRKQSVCSLGSDLADVCNSNRWNYTGLLPLPVQTLSCGYSRFYHQADALPSQQLSPCDPLGSERTISWLCWWSLRWVSLSPPLHTAVILASR